MKLNKGLIAAAVVAPLVQFSASLQAAPVFGPNGSFNSIELVAVENQYRATGSCTSIGNSASGADCLTATGDDPAGYNKVNPGVASNTDVGDLFIGILNIRDISNNLTGTTWNSDNVAAGGIDTFTGYFVQEVLANFAPPDPFDPTQTDDNHITLGASAVDPFGVLSGSPAGTMFALYVDDGSQATGNTVFTRNGAGGFGVLGDISNATDGDLWAYLGEPVGLCDEAECTPGYNYTHTDDTLTGFNIEGTFFFALNSLLHGPAYNLPNLHPINDFTEAELGGVATSGINGICSPLAPFPITCTEFIGQAELTANQSGPIGGGNEPWFFENNDPINLYIPEPNSMALVGLALAGFGALQKRRARRGQV